MTKYVDEKEVERIALRFFEQHHDVYKIKVVGLENGIWLVEGEVSSSSGVDNRKLRIDAETGKIIAVE